MNLLDLFDKELGAKLRAGLAVALAIATFAVAVLQATADALRFLPEWEQLGAVALWIQGAVSLIGRFTAIGQRIQ